MKKWKTYLLYGVLGLLILGVIGAMFGEPQDIKAISIQDDLTMDVNKEKKINVSIEPSDAKLSKDDFVIGDDSIVEIDSIDGNTITLKTLAAEGTTTLYCQKDNIKSNELSIQVTDQQKLALAKAEEQRKAEEKIAETKKATEEKKAAELKATEARKAKEEVTQKSTTKNTSNSTTKPTGEQVYITPTGKKYHAIAKCGNTKSSTKVSLSNAQGKGLEPCQKCY